MARWSFRKQHQVAPSGEITHGASAIAPSPYLWEYLAAFERTERTNPIQFDDRLDSAPREAHLPAR
jgi:hypothetical protein